ncbi:hypothetical protein [Actinoallomurus acaciae]|uniref:Uncharacterized protein n=1 Tax=Actinoallomurus acaciae TaxID=502577 RepID=A0ABV5Y715_9ACTN
MSEFLDAVAERAHMAVETAAKILADHGIEEYLPARPAARLRIDRVGFSGVKDLQSDPPGEEFTFEMEVPEGSARWLARATRRARRAWWRSSAGC